MAELHKPPAVSGSKGQYPLVVKADQPALPSNRSFGRLFFVVFGVLAVIVGWQDWTPLASVLLALALGFLGVAQFAPGLLLPLNRVWMAFARLLNKVVSPIAMGVIFFFLITPIALMMRIFGRDELDLRRPPRRDSLWKARVPDQNSQVDFSRQY